MVIKKKVRGQELPHIIIPYNEILPTKRAHDVFVFNECSYLAQEGLKVTLLCGKGSRNDLASHYHSPQSDNFNIKKLPILRRNNFLGINANFPFFYFTQRTLHKMKPDFVILSVFKQGKYHLKRKRPGIKYIYEVHQLSYYPNSSYDNKKLAEEKHMLSKADLIITTTRELTSLLQHNPYQLKVPIHTLPLAVNVASLPPPPQKEPFTVAYIGQLYKEQGLSFLLKALSQTPFYLKVIGGKPEEIGQFQQECQNLGIEKRVIFLGFCPPSQLVYALADVHAFVAPFEAKGKMSYVAHTKLCEYADWKRPVVAPNIDVVKDCFPHDLGVKYFMPEDPFSLAKTLRFVYENYQSILKEITSEKRFTWKQRTEQYVKILGL